MRKLYSVLFVLSILFTAQARADEVQKDSLAQNAAVIDKETANLKVSIGGINGKKGEIGIALYENKKGYPLHFQYTYEALWIPLEGGKNTIEAAFEALPPGEYAVSVLHDENGNRKMDRNSLGFPREGVGFSNDQKVVFGSPSFEKSKFPLSAGESKEAAITLDYRKE